MCNGDKKCAKCMSADGNQKEYNPKQIAAWINQYIYKGKATPDQLKEAYTPTMVFLESKKLSFTGESISANSDEIKVAINDPNYLTDKTADERSGWKLAALLVAFVIVWYYVFKEDGWFSSGPSASSLPPAPAPPVYVAPPAPPVAPPVPPLTPAAV